MIDIASKIQQCHKQIAELSAQYQRSANSVQLLAVSKGQSIDKIKQAVAYGQRTFAENYIQEALDKMQELAEFDLQWHFIGRVQSNKAKLIAEHFAWLHSLMSEKLAVRLNAFRTDGMEPLNVCLQVNISNEANKQGLQLAEVEALAANIKALPKLQLRGLMGMAAADIDFDEQCRQFNLLTECFAMLQKKGYKLDTLSMGMSHDMDAAIASGSTMLRIGRAIFGEREQVRG